MNLTFFLFFFNRVVVKDTVKNNTVCCHQLICAKTLSFLHQWLFTFGADVKMVKMVANTLVLQKIPLTSWNPWKCLCSRVLTTLSGWLWEHFPMPNASKTWPWCTAVFFLHTPRPGSGSHKVWVADSSEQVAQGLSQATSDICFNQSLCRSI